MREVFKQVKFASERLKEQKEQKKNNGGVLVAESAFISQNGHFGLLMLFTKHIHKTVNETIKS